MGVDLPLDGGVIVVCGEAGEGADDDPGQRKGSLSRFFSDQGPAWYRDVGVVVVRLVLLPPTDSRSTGSWNSDGRWTTIAVKLGYAEPVSTEPSAG